MLIKVLKTHPHGGRPRKQGEVYECPDKKARLMIALRKAVEFTPPAPPPSPTRARTTKKKVTPRAKPAEPSTDDKTTSEAKGTYQTKVMVPDD